MTLLHPQILAFLSLRGSSVPLFQARAFQFGALPLTPPRPRRWIPRGPRDSLNANLWFLSPRWAKNKQNLGKPMRVGVDPTHWATESRTNLTTLVTITKFTFICKTRAIRAAETGFTVPGDRQLCRGFQTHRTRVHNYIGIPPPETLKQQRTDLRCLSVPLATFPACWAGFCWVINDPR